MSRLIAKDKTTIYIESSALLNNRLSGIGHLTLSMIKGLRDNQDFKLNYKLKLIVPINKTHFLSHWSIDDIEIVKIPLPARIWNVIPKLRFIPPIDLFIGKGLYIFPNFRAWPLYKSKSITYIHDISFLLYPEFTEEKNLKMLKNNIHYWMKNSTTIVTDSNASNDEIREHFDEYKEKIKTIYCGVDTQLFTTTDTKRSGVILERYGIDKPYIMFLSNLEPRKNVERLLAALQNLPLAYKNKYKIVLVGGMSWNNTSIYTKINELRSEGWDIIKPDSYVPDKDIPILLANASVLVHPAIHEGFGIPPIEAMSCGTPVIVSDIKVLREICSEAAIYIDPYDIKDIATKIEHVLSNSKLQSQLTTLGRENARTFTWENSTNSLIKELRSLVDRGKK